MQTSLHINDKEYEIRSIRLNGMPERYVLTVEGVKENSRVDIFTNKKMVMMTEDNLIDILYRFAEDVLQTKNTDDLQELVGNYMEEL